MPNRGVPIAVFELGLAGLFACTHGTDRPGLHSPDSAVVAQSQPAPQDHVQVGLATWYGGKLAGHKTASGEPFDPRQMTAAHRTLPFGTWVEVRRIGTGESVRVRITDRGPFGHEDRIIDLSRGAAEKIGLVRAGVARVEVTVVGGP